MSLSPWIWALILGITAVAGLVRGFTGFGGALVMTPVLLTWLDPVRTTALVVLVNVVAGIWQAREIHREADRPLVRALCVAGLLMAPVGLWAIQLLPAVRVQQVVGAVVLAITMALVTGWRMPISIHRRSGQMILGGASGFLFGLGGIGGPPVVLGLLAARMAPRSARATQLAYFSIIQVVVLLIVIVQGVMTPSDWLLGAFLSLVYTLTGVLGGRLLTDARERLFRSASIAVLCAVSGYALAGV